MLSEQKKECARRVAVNSALQHEKKNLFIAQVSKPLYVDKISYVFSLFVTLKDSLPILVVYSLPLN